MSLSRSTLPLGGTFFQDAVRSHQLLAALRLVIKVPPATQINVASLQPPPPHPESSQHENKRVQQKHQVGVSDANRLGKRRSLGRDSLNLLAAAAALASAQTRPTLPVQTRP